MSLLICIMVNVKKNGSVGYNMKCYKHNHLDAVGQCQDCGKAMCKECSDQYTLHLCDNCLIGNNEQVKNSFIKGLIFPGIIFVICFLFFLSVPMDGENIFAKIFGALLISYYFASVPFGWRVLNKIKFNFILMMPIGGWFVYFVIKGGLSMLIGLFSTPFFIYKHIKEIKSINRLKQEILVEKAS